MPKQPRNHEPTIGIFDLLERTDTDEAQTTPLRGHPDLTLRDEANAITARSVASRSAAVGSAATARIDGSSPHESRRNLECAAVQYVER